MEQGEPDRPGFRGLIVEVRPHALGARLRHGTELRVAVIAGTLAAGDALLLEQPGGGHAGCSVDSVEDVTDALLEDWRKLGRGGSPPPPGAELVVRCQALPPSEVPIYAVVRSPGRGAGSGPAPSAWAVVLAELGTFEDALSLVGLFERSNGGLRANGEGPERVIGVSAVGDRAFAAAVGARMKAVHGDSFGDVTFEAAVRAEEPDDGDMAALVERLGDLGIELTGAG